jgi:hypothetical protein
MGSAGGTAGEEWTERSSSDVIGGLRFFDALVALRPAWDNALSASGVQG